MKIIIFRGNSVNPEENLHVIDVQRPSELYGVHVVGIYPQADIPDDTPDNRTLLNAINNRIEARRPIIVRSVSCL
jgi:hypothetical protein